jgi:hypothetical protein
MCYGNQSLVASLFVREDWFLFLGLPSPLKWEHLARYPTLSVLSQWLYTCPKTQKYIFRSPGSGEDHGGNYRCENLCLTTSNVIIITLLFLGGLFLIYSKLVEDSKDYVISIALSRLEINESLFAPQSALSWWEKPDTSLSTIYKHASSVYISPRIKHSAEWHADKMSLFSHSATTGWSALHLVRAQFTLSRRFWHWLINTYQSSRFSM